MIKEIMGDLIKMDTHFIAHQVNCRGVMGAGVAYQVRRRLLGEQSYNDYRAICRNMNFRKLLGTNQYCPIKSGQVVVNMFGENVPTGTKVDTDYKALWRCLEDLKRSMEQKEKDAAIPGYLGSGLAGGCWEFVYTSIICPLFADCNQTLYIVYRDDSILRLWNEFQDVPRNKNGGISETWHGFEIFTDSFFIVKWFENTFKIRAWEDLLGKQDDITPLFSHPLTDTSAS